MNVLRVMVSAAAGYTVQHLGFMDAPQDDRVEISVALGDPTCMRHDEEISVPNDGV